MEAHEQAAEMAVLAQSKFNETRQHLQSLKNCGRGGGKVAGSKYTYIQQQQQQEKPNVSDPDNKAQELLSTLLYLSTMLEKVDGMKAMLKNHNLALYDEWRPLFDALSSPSTTLREQSNQKDRIKRLERRKNHYKEEATKRKVEAAKMQEAVQKSESQLKEQISTMSNSIAKLEGRLAEKEDTMESLVHTQSAEKARLEDELVGSKKSCETVQGELSDLEIELEEARVENTELRATTKEKDVVIEDVHTENNAKSKSFEALQNELGKVTELEDALQQKFNEISFLRAKLEASDRHQEELAKIIAKQQQQQQQQRPHPETKDDPAPELAREKMTKADDLSTTYGIDIGKEDNTNKTDGTFDDKNYGLPEDNLELDFEEEPTVSSVRVGDDESVASDKCRLEVASAIGESKSEALEVELPLCGQQDEEDAVEVTAENGLVGTSSASIVGIDISSNVDSDADNVKEEAAADDDGDKDIEDISLAAEANDIGASSSANMATISSSAVDCDNENQAATSIRTSTVDEAEEHTCTNITTNDDVCLGSIGPATTVVVAQKIVDNAVEEAVNSCT